MLQRDGFFGSKRETKPDPMFKPVMPPPPPPPAHAARDPEATVPAERKENKAKLVVGPDIKMKGAEVIDCDTLVVEGRMEATLDSRVLEIAEHGFFHGTIAVDNATIHGRFEGELTVRKQLLIEGTGRVTGKVRYSKIRIQEGAELSGDISVLDKPQAANTAAVGAPSAAAGSAVNAPRRAPVAAA